MFDSGLSGLKLSMSSLRDSTYQMRKPCFQVGPLPRESSQLLESLTLLKQSEGGPPFAMGIKSLQKQAWATMCIQLTHQWGSRTGYAFLDRMATFEMGLQCHSIRPLVVLDSCQVSSGHRVNGNTTGSSCDPWVDSVSLHVCAVEFINLSNSKQNFPCVESPMFPGLDFL